MEWQRVGRNWAHNGIGFLSRSGFFICKTEFGLCLRLLLEPKKKKQTNPLTLLEENSKHLVCRRIQKSLLKEIPGHQAYIFSLSRYKTRAWKLAYITSSPVILILPDKEVHFEQFCPIGDLFYCSVFVGLSLLSISLFRGLSHIQFSILKHPLIQVITQLRHNTTQLRQWIKKKKSHIAIFNPFKRKVYMYFFPLISRKPTLRQRC